MIRKTTSPTPNGETSSDAPVGERIAKVLARAGVASRRDAEKIVLSRRVSVNGKVVDRVAMNVLPTDKIAVDGVLLGAPDVERVWLYHKPVGLVTTTRDEQGRPTIFDNLPEDMPRVMSIGRLDINSEGLLLLTNDGEIKHKLELPSTGWLRKYRVRVNGFPSDATFEPLRNGITIDGEEFQPMQISLDRQIGSNAWLTVGIREGKNREIRRAMEQVGLSVNRLIRVSYGPFQLGQLEVGEVMEVRRRMLRDQLGMSPADEPREDGKRQLKPRGKPMGDRPARSDGEDRPKFSRSREDAGDGRSRFPKRDGDKPRFSDRPRPERGDDDKPAVRRPRSDKPFSADGPKRAFRKPEGDARSDDKPRFGARGDGKPAGRRPFGDKPQGASDGARRPYQKDGEKRFGGPKRDGDAPRRDDGGKPRYRKPEGERSFGRSEGERTRSDGPQKSFRKPSGDKPFGKGGGSKSFGSKSHADRGTQIDAPRGPRKPGGRPNKPPRRP